MTTSDPQSLPSLAQIDLSAEVERLEALAALADGRLDDARRAELLARLADDAESLDLLAEVMALSEEMDLGEDEERPAADSDFVSEAKVLRGPWRKQAWAAVGAIAAVLAVVVLMLPRMSSKAPTPQSVLAAMDASRLDADALGRPPWSPLRGGGGEVGFKPVGPRDSFRWGILATDLEAALLTRNDEARRWLASEFRRVVPSFVDYDSLTTPTAPFEEALAEHAKMQDILPLDPFYYRYGLWTRGAWLAASSGQLGFFRGKSARSLEALEPPDAVRAEWSKLLEQVKDLEGEDDLAELVIELAAILDHRSG